MVKIIISNLIWSNDPGARVRYTCSSLLIQISTGSETEAYEHESFVCEVVCLYCGCCIARQRYALFYGVCRAAGTERILSRPRLQCPSLVGGGDAGSFRPGERV